MDQPSTMCQLLQLGWKKLVQGSSPVASLSVGISVANAAACQVSYQFTFGADCAALLDRLAGFPALSSQVGSKWGVRMTSPELLRQALGKDSLRAGSRQHPACRPVSVFPSCAFPEPQPAADLG